MDHILEIEGTTIAIEAKSVDVLVDYRQLVLPQFDKFREAGIV